MSYRVTFGSDTPILVERSELTIDRKDATLLPGVNLVGNYAVTGQPVFSFLYYKQNEEGDIEDEERVVIHTGFGRGVHPGHFGQESTLYLVGVDVARLACDAVKVTKWAVEESGLVTPKHFSIDCMVNGVMGTLPVLANS